MKEMLNNWIKELNRAIDNSAECYALGKEIDNDEMFNYWEGKITAYIDTIVDLCNALDLDTDIDPKTGHVYLINKAPSPYKGTWKILVYNAE